MHEHSDVYKVSLGCCISSLSINKYHILINKLIVVLSNCSQIINTFQCEKTIRCKLPASMYAWRHMYAHTLINGACMCKLQDAMQAVIYQNRKRTGTRWLWQQNEIPLLHNNPT